MLKLVHDQHAEPDRIVSCRFINMTRYQWIIFLIIIIITIVVGLSLLNHISLLAIVKTTPNTQNINGDNIQAPTSVPVVTATDLVDAGFSGVEQQQPANGRFSPPNLYFTVQQNIPNSPNGNMVMILVANTGNLNSMHSYGSNTKSFNISGGTGQEGTMPDGRTAINFIKNTFYVVIIGPGVYETEKLVLIISSKIR